MEKQTVPGTWTGRSSGSCAADPGVSQTCPSKQSKTQKNTAKRSETTNGWRIIYHLTTQTQVWLIWLGV